MSDLSNLIKNKYAPKLEQVMRDSMRELSTRIVVKTPVDSGSLRASWTANRGEPVANNINIGGGVTASRNPIASVIDSIMPGDKYSFANGQPYARRIEYEAWSQQASQGMIRIAVAEWQQRVNEAVRGG